jgi:RNA polymerase sigma factor (sigma-70 family)
VIAAFLSWLFAIVKRECVRLAKRALPRGPALEALDESLLIGARPDHELRLDLVRAITSLPAHYRDVIVLRDFEELTIAEIAVATESTKQATKARLHRARVLVREYLDSP